MKRKAMFTVLAMLLILSFVLLAACDDTENPFSEKQGVQKSFTLDLYGDKTITVDANTYIDENGAEGAVYSMVSSDLTVLSITGGADNKFTATALKAGNATATLRVSLQENSLEVTLSFTVVNTEPGAPVLEKQQYAYDKSAGGDFELPVDLKGGTPSILRADNLRLAESVWSYNKDTGCIVLTEEYCLGLALGDYSMELVTTGGSAAFVLSVENSVVTSFDETTAKTASLGKAEGISFAVTFNGTTVEKITYGDLVLKQSDYVVSESGIEIKQEFYAKTFSEDERMYILYLSNNDTYVFSITAENQLFYSDYDVTMIHDGLQSVTGQNPLYQDSTRVEIVDAPEGMQGKVLKYTPHTDDVPLNVYGIFTFASSASSSTWRKINFIEGRTYVVSFDYFTEGTTEGEDFRFRSYTGSFSSPALDTDSSGGGS